ncbi:MULTISPECIES: hypothetical protein [unclassified Spiroplasma]|uniref:hypothetical protein n=1 Tax=unclassified Spiroplasma TaxID=2637901 RepID=UPI0027E1CF09|nr:hypothetical protein [Spiroplasma sp. AdecLV25b]
MKSCFYKDEIIYYATNLEKWANVENKTYFIKFQDTILRLTDIINTYDLKNIAEIKIYKFLANAFNSRILKEVGIK